ncbi:type II secretion system protein F [Peptostreptococcaceae bacterium AS15]|nr:bacterial type II secretion system domain protein F [[Eubacterium] yurii subsp. margaretiae ATCC 43715]EJP19236.1 type II secretion system protein F [Peptostreptococcaceae bacterium AS15]
MPKYNYIEIDSADNIVQGTMEAGSSGEVISLMKSRGSRPIEVSEDIKGLGGVNITVGKRRIKSKDLSVFSKQLYTMLHAGMPLLTCIETLKDQVQSKLLREKLIEIYQDLQKGAIFSTALQKHGEAFPELFISMVRSGELTGNMDGVLNNLSTHYQKEARLQAQIRSAMIYPIIVLMVAIGVTVFMLVKLVPMFKSFFRGKALPGITQFVVNLSDFMISKWYIIIAVVVGVVFLINRYISTPVGRMQFDTNKLRAPGVGGLLRTIASSRFASTLSVLISSGIPIIQAIESSGQVTNNVFIQKNMAYAIDNIKKGSPMSVELKKLEIFPPMMISMLKIGEESGAIDSMLQKTSDFFEEELEEAIKRMTSMMEPLIIILVGGIVAVVLISVYLPMFDMSTMGVS